VPNQLEDSKQLVRLLRSLADLGREEFAAAAKIAPRSYRRYENGKTVPPRKALERMAHVADVPLSWLDTGLRPALTATRLLRTAGRCAPEDGAEELRRLDTTALGAALGELCRAALADLSVRLGSSEADARLGDAGAESPAS
jgi:transcriptional regulator with XRE-family HTH domain